MQSRLERHRKILELVDKAPIGTQSALQQSLSKSGFEVNQATLSRDMRELGLIKLESEGTFRYVSRRQMPKLSTAETASAPLIETFIEDIDFSGNTVIVKTGNGAASYVAEAIDNLQIREILGTVAGDNTLIMVIREGAKAPLVIQKMRKSLRLR